MSAPSEIVCDVCIVGTGVAGSLLAASLSSVGKSVVIVEAGKRLDRAKQQESIAAGGRTPVFDPTDPKDYVPKAVHSNFSYKPWQVIRVGGNTTHWGGWCPRPHSKDFALASSYGVGVDWPISYDALEPYYCRAEEELGVRGDPSEHAPRRSRPFVMPHFPLELVEKTFIGACDHLGYSWERIPVARPSQPYRNRPVCCRAGLCWTCPTGARYAADTTHLADAVVHPRVTLLERHRALHFTVADGNSRVALKVADDAQTPKLVRAGIFLLAANSLGSLQILLSSRDHALASRPAFLARSSTTLGRYLVDHAAFDQSYFARTRLKAMGTAFPLATRQFEDGDWRKERAAVRVSFHDGWGPDRIAKNLITDGVYGREFVDQLRDQSERSVSFILEAEVLPRQDNRVELNPALPDAYGDPGLTVNMNIGEYEDRGITAGIDAVQKIAALLCEPKPFPYDRGNVFSGTHLSGGARMGKDPKTSVVDTNLRLHDLPNVYMASSAVFPSCVGASNPTLTLAALTLRLSDHIRGLHP